LDIISGLPVTEVGSVVLVPLVIPGVSLDLDPLVNPEGAADVAGVVALLPLEKPELLGADTLDPLEKLLLPPPPPPPPPPPLASAKLAPTTNKLSTIANHSDFLSMFVSFHFNCSIEFDFFDVEVYADHNVDEILFRRPD
jgi:hypothetical protein